MNYLTELFEITFIDDSKLWCTIDQNQNITFGTLGKGLNIPIIDFLEGMESKYICPFANEFSSNIFVKEYIDKVREKSDLIEKQLFKAS